MDSGLLKAMLDSQERAYKAAIDVVVKQMNDQVSKLEKTVSDHTTSLEFTQRELDDLKSEVKKYRREEREAKIRIGILEEKVNHQEDYNRRKNIRINGVAEGTNGETWEQTATLVTSLLRDKMQLGELVLERAHRVGPRSDAKPRTVIACFSRFCDREAVMRNARKLKGTNIFVDDDLCPASQAVKNSQMPLLKQARAQGKIAFFRRTKLVIKERYNGVAAGGERRAARSPGGGGAGAVCAGAGGDVRSGPAATGGVVDVQVAGTWSDGNEGVFPSLPTPAGSRLQRRSSPASPQRKMEKKNLRSGAKK